MQREQGLKNLHFQIIRPKRNKVEHRITWVVRRCLLKPAGSGAQALKVPLHRTGHSISHRKQQTTVGDKNLQTQEGAQGEDRRHGSAKQHFFPVVTEDLKKVQEIGKLAD